VGRRIVIAAAVLLAATLGGDVSGQARPVSTTKLRIAVRAPEPFVHAPARPRRAPPGTLVALVRPDRVVAVRSAPDGPVVARLGARTEFGSPRTFAASRSGTGLRVITTELPNGRRGWVGGKGALRLSRTTLALDVDLSSRVLRVRADTRLLRTMRVGIGAPGTATPTGRFAITDKLSGSRFSSVYGCCILALSGHQTNLPRGWTGGDRLAIHGGSIAGAVSTGCLHAAEADLRWLRRAVPLGAQITIHP
jgi:L,D-transpeptidase catalytic domain